MVKKFIIYILNKLYPLNCWLNGIRKNKPSRNGVLGYIDGQQNVIVSLTTFPARINYILPTLNTLLRQNVKPNLLILWLSKKQFSNESIPNGIKQLEQYGLTIELVEEDMKSYKKLIPALAKYPNDIIVTADDDLYYPKNWLKELLKSYHKYPSDIHSQLITKIQKKNNFFDSAERKKTDVGKSSYCYKLLSGSGVLFPPGIFDSTIFESNIFMNNLSTSDDIWYWANAVKNNVKIRWIKNNMKKLYFVEKIQEETPCLWEVNDRNERDFFKHLNYAIDRYGISNKLDY